MQISIFDQIAKLTLGVRLGILVIAILLVGGGFYLLFYQEELDQLESLERRHKKLKRDLASFKQKHATYIRDIEELNRRRARQKEQMRILPRDTEMSSFVNDINNLAELCGLQISSVTPKSEEGKGFYAAIPVMLKLKGTYHQVAKFFYGVGQLERIINLEDISLSGKTSSQKDGDIILSVNVRATTFRSLEGKKGR